VTPRLRKARWGTLTTFALAGAQAAVWSVRIPALTDKLHLDAGDVATSALLWGLGAVLTMQLARPVMARIGSRRVLQAALPATTALLAVYGLAPTFPVLLAVSVLFGAVFSLLDATMNAQASLIERVAGRHLMNGMHAGWSVGAVTGGALGALAAWAGLSYTHTLVAMAVLSVPAVAVVLPTYLPDRPGAVPDGQRSRVRLPWTVYLVGAIAFASFVIEGSVSTWSGLFLRGELHTAEWLAALGYPLFEGAMIVGRLTGDRVRSRIGSTPMLTGAGLVAAAGFGVVLAAGRWWLALTGFFLVGLAVATVVPLAFSIAGDVDPSGSGAGIAQAGAIAYSGILIGPMMIGYVADAAGLRAGLTTVLALAVVMSVLGARAPGGRPRSGPPVTERVEVAPELP